MSFIPAPYKGWASPNYAFDKRRATVERGIAQQVQNSMQVGTATVALPQIGGVSGVVTSRIDGQHQLSLHVYREAGVHLRVGAGPEQSGPVRPVPSRVGDGARLDDHFGRILHPLLGLFPRLREHRAERAGGRAALHVHWQSDVELGHSL